VPAPRHPEDPEANCEEDYPELAECYETDGSVWKDRTDALNDASGGRPILQPSPRPLKQLELCMGSPSPTRDYFPANPVHINVVPSSGGGATGSVVCCPCCVDDPGGEGGYALEELCRSTRPV
jgi:hypothetical protein